MKFEVQPGSLYAILDTEAREVFLTLVNLGGTQYKHLTDMQFLATVQAALVGLSEVYLCADLCKEKTPAAYRQVGAYLKDSYTRALDKHVDRAIETLTPETPA